jgi:hypothetical protein
MTRTRDNEIARRYQQWNTALIQYFTVGVGVGERIYLSVDDETLDNIGRRFSSKEVPRGKWSQAFQRAVKEYVVNDGAVDLEVLQGRDPKRRPRGVAFLGLCVLAASHMANEDEISDINYFTRLKEILQVSSNTPRPRGMSSGCQAEEPLWRDWNLWLLERGFQPSAHEGSGPRKYIEYPISQCLLRQADKDRLQEFFYRQEWTNHYSWDARSLWGRIRPHANSLPSHLQNLMTTNPRRYDAVAEAIHEVYQQWHAEGCPERSGGVNSSRNTFNRNLYAGLYRNEEPFSGDISYYLYPKQQRGREISNIIVEYQNVHHHLKNDPQSPGWYLPIGDRSLDSQDISNGLTCSLSNSDELENLILPARDFWILVPEPDNPDSEVHASWRNPDLGTRFILLCKNRENLIQDIKRLKEERLLEFAGQPKQVNNFNWVEFHQCMIISQAWDGVCVSNLSLKEALQPVVKLSIGLSGGLRSPDKSGWLENYLPEITVFGFSSSVILEIRDLATSKIILTREQSVNQPYSLSLSKGIFLLRVSVSGEDLERFIRVESWDSLNLAFCESREGYRVGEKHIICGSTIQEV